MATITADTPTARATLRYLRVSPSKAREVLKLIRDVDAERARDILRFCERAVARDIAKLLDSAIANAENNLALPVDELKVAVAFADEGPTLKRWRPRARGRATRIRKRTCHVTLIVARMSENQLQIKARKDAATRPPASGGRRRRVKGSETPAKEKATVADSVAEDPVVEEPTVAAVADEAVLADVETSQEVAAEATEESAAVEAAADPISEDKEEE